MTNIFNSRSALGRASFLGCFLLVQFLVAPWTKATVDLNGDGASELWNLQYVQILADDSDYDSDGQSNRSEAIAGTDPTDGSHYFRLNRVVLEEGEVVLSWAGVPGKEYGIEGWNRQEREWVELERISSPQIAGIIEARHAELEDVTIYRIRARDIDADQDGVNAWEEHLLGWNDDSANSSGNSDSGDFEQALRMLEGESGTTLTSGIVLPQRLPSAAEASRFLVQTSFGPTRESIAEVMEMGMGAYFDQQLTLDSTLTRTSMWQSGNPYSAGLWRHGWWRSALVAPDQLRQRMAYALSQIFVVNTEGGTIIGDNVNTQAAYYDAFITDGFGSFRGLLNHVSYSPMMGFYLSHLNNRKSDPSVNRFPDENFAREIMQLFTIGLWELNPDGTRKLDEAGRNIPTYDNTIITEMAKVFTGMSNGTTNRGQVATGFDDPATGDDYVAPMIVWDNEHEAGSKVLFNDVIIPAGQTGDQDVQLALDALSDHNNTGPFIGRRLIQRFTSSNPSPEYMVRVTRAWERSNGELGEVMRAVLFDPEARSVDLGAGTRGKLREPLLRMTHIMRAFALPDSSGRYGVLATKLNRDLGQFAMSSPSVFNFYLPDHAPRGVIFESGLVAPEFQIATTSALLATHDLLKATASSGHWVRSIDYTEELALLPNPEELVNDLNILLTFGTMGPATKAAVLDRISGESSSSSKVKVAVQTIVVSPEFSILK